MTPEVNRQINKLREDLEDIKRQLLVSGRVDQVGEEVGKLVSYLTYRDGDRFLSVVEAHGLDPSGKGDWYSFVEDERVQFQLRADYVLMMRAADEDDMPGYCLRAFQQLEGLTRYFLSHLSQTDYQAYKYAWNRYCNGYLDNPKDETEWEEPPNPSMTVKATMRDLRPVVFLVVYDYYPEWRSKEKLIWKDHEIRPRNKNVDSLNMLLNNLTKIRNWCVHRSGVSGPFDMTELNEPQQRYFRYRPQHFDDVGRALSGLAADVSKYVEGKA